MKTIALLIVNILFLGAVVAQTDTLTDDDDWKVYDPSRYTNEPDTTPRAYVEPLEWDGKPGKVQIFKDSRLDDLTAFVYGDSAAVEQPTIAGYRVQVMKTQDKSEANGELTRFRFQYDNIPIESVWNSPDYNIQVGDCRTKLEAEKVRNQILEMYPGAYIIKTDIYLPSLD